MQLGLTIVAVVVVIGMELPEFASASSFVRASAVPMSWHRERRMNLASGDRSCFVISRGGEVSASLLRERQAKTATWSVRVGIDNQPGSVRYLRINKRYFQTIHQSFRGSDAVEIVELLRSPGEFAFEWGQQPDYRKRGGLFRTGDFSARAAECERWVYGTPA